MTAEPKQRLYRVKVRGHLPVLVLARNRSAAKYKAGQALNVTNAMWIAWARVEWARLAPIA